VTWGDGSVGSGQKRAESARAHTEEKASRDERTGGVRMDRARTGSNERSTPHQNSAEPVNVMIRSVDRGIGRVRSDDMLSCDRHTERGREREQESDRTDASHDTIQIGFIQWSVINHITAMQCNAIQFNRTAATFGGAQQFGFRVLVFAVFCLVFL